MKTKHYLSKFLSTAIVAGVCLITQSAAVFAQEQTSSKPALEKVGKHEILGNIDGVDVEGIVQSPSNEAAPLQIICVFEYEEGDIYNSPPALPAAANGLVHVDKQMRGLLTSLRKNGKFHGEALETILLTPPKGMISAHRLLIIGMGNKKDFTPDLMIKIGRVGMLEALRLGVSSYAQASDLKDGGVDSPTGLIAQNVVKGAFEGYEANLFLERNKLAPKDNLKKITLLAGQAYFDISGAAIKEYIKSRPTQ